jgi:hypothetical protein
MSMLQNVLYYCRDKKFRWYVVAGKGKALKHVTCPAWTLYLSHAGYRRANLLGADLDGRPIASGGMYCRLTSTGSKLSSRKRNLLIKTTTETETSWVIQFI